MTSSRTTRRSLVIAGFVAAVCGCGGDDSAIECSDRTVEIKDLVAIARSLEPEMPESERISAAVRRAVVRCAILAEPPTPEERAKFERFGRWNRARQCVEVEIRRRLAGDEDLPGEPRSRFEADPEAFFQPESFRLQLIFIPGTEPGSTALADRLFEEIRVDPDRFPELARRHSKSETAAAGGMTKPMPGTMVHQKMRQAIGLHHESGEPFLVTTDNGSFVARVLEYWPPIAGSWEDVAQRVTQQVVQEAIGEITQELIREADSNHEITVQTDLFNRPLVAPETSVYTIDDRSFTVADLLPAMDQSETVPGPSVRGAVGAFRRWYEPATALGCFDETTAIDEELLFGSRLVPSLTSFVVEHMGDDLRSFAQMHEDVLISDREFVFDLWLFPFRGTDPYDDLQRYQPALEAARDGGPIPADAVDFDGIRMSEAQVAAYDPGLSRTLGNLETGETSELMMSRRLRSFVAARLERRVDERPLDIDDADDRRRIADAMISQHDDLALDAFAAHLENDCRVSPNLEQTIATELHLKPGETEHRPE